MIPLFDLDGTLIDTLDGFVACFHLAGIDCTPEQIRPSINLGTRGMIKAACNLTEDHPDFDSLRQHLLTSYENECISGSKFFCGIEQMLAQLKTPWGIVTNKPRLFAEKTLAALNVKTDILVCPEDVEHAKPHAEPLLKALSALNICAANAIFFGDSIIDIQTGKAAGTKTAICSWGFICPEINLHSWQADYICHNTDDVTALLK